MSPDLWCWYSWIKSDILKEMRDFHIPSGGSLFNLFFIFPSDVLAVRLPFALWLKLFLNSGIYTWDNFWKQSSTWVSLLRKIKMDKSVSLSAGGVCFVPWRKDLFSQAKKWQDYIVGVLALLLLHSTGCVDTEGTDTLIWHLRENLSLLYQPQWASCLPHPS